MREQPEGERGSEARGEKGKEENKEAGTVPQRYSFHILMIRGYA